MNIAGVDRRRNAQVLLIVLGFMAISVICQQPVAQDEDNHMNWQDDESSGYYAYYDDLFYKDYQPNQDYKPNSLFDNQIVNNNLISEKKIEPNKAEYDPQSYEYNYDNFDSEFYEIDNKVSQDSFDTVDKVESVEEPSKPQAYESSRSKLLKIIIKPGILAGIVGGAIIGVLTAILLIMFIVYRMKKKDEGSYALEETKKPLNAYDYRNCPTKEFYA
ncbi:Syndecan [Brachionus plicatilis]|uniref:Syndecan n=1 Tax=Brachionus plicatilis TaxID=10195 RepID=A0A3M7T659_BRAPC|nr:Syndecan [Brachionus plicatilis]